MRDGLPPERQRLVGELLRGEEVALGAEAVGAAAVAYVSAHRAPPLRVLQGLRDVLAHAHLEAVAAPVPAPAPARGRAAPLPAHASGLAIGGFLAAEVTRGALDAPGAVDVLAPHLARAVVAAPGAAPAVQPVVVFDGVVLGVLALRRAELRELGADRARVHAQDGSARAGPARGRGGVAAEHHALVLGERGGGRGRGGGVRRGRAAGGGVRRGRGGGADLDLDLPGGIVRERARVREALAHATPEEGVLRVGDVRVGDERVGIVRVPEDGRAPARRHRECGDETTETAGEARERDLVCRRFELSDEAKRCVKPFFCDEEQNDNEFKP